MNVFFERLTEARARVAKCKDKLAAAKDAEERAETCIKDECKKRGYPYGDEEEMGRVRRCIESAGEIKRDVLRALTKPEDEEAWEWHSGDLDDFDCCNGGDCWWQGNLDRRREFKGAYVSIWDDSIQICSLCLRQGIPDRFVEANIEEARGSYFSSEWDAHKEGAAVSDESMATVWARLMLPVSDEWIELRDVDGKCTGKAWPMPCARKGCTAPPAHALVGVPGVCLCAEHHANRASTQRADYAMFDDGFDFGEWMDDVDKIPARSL